MKVNNSIAMNMGRNESAAGQKAEARKSVFAGNLNQQGDPILTKKRQAQQKAMKIIGDTFATERKVDEEQEKRRENVKELTAQLHELEEYIAAQKDMPEEEMTAEMKEAQQEAIREYEKQSQEIKGEIKAELITIEATKIERLKESPMVEASECAEKVLEAATEEVVDMLMQEAKENLEEKLEEKEEQAEKLAEKREEEEERIAHAKEEKQEAQAMAKQVKEAAAADVQKEIEEMLNKLKLLEEDIKGAAVDELL